ncbi:MAG TPA: hypothetical protein DCR44_02340 [Acholeplasmatales bacterium]|nr:MAG: hypothetical protein A2Y16_01655 [Tenericutes bacterium GWF2_57_13]HAQ56231.1 hypothetical protein [Acholeplasmatales bacterium]
MKKLVCFVILAIAVSCFLISCSTPEIFGYDIAVEKNIAAVDDYPAIPANYSYFDYLSKAVALDAVVFGFAADPDAATPSYIAAESSTWNPIGFWIDQARVPADYDPLVSGYLERSFGLPTYVGDSRVLSSGSEAITTIAMVLGSSYAGIDKSAQSFGSDVYDFVAMTLASYDTGSKLVHNVGIQGQSFWYDMFPQIMFARLYDLYPDTPYMRQIVINGADQWLEALPFFVDENGDPDYEFVGYNVVLESPTIEGAHIEPPNGGLAFLFYAAYAMTGEARYLDGAKEVLDYLQDYPRNPNYEALTDYAPYVAAALNARYGTNYDIGKFLDFLFEGDSAFRAGWSVMDGTFDGVAVDGLVGQGGDYAFAMNSFHLATVLAPLVKYDERYAASIGKYLLNLANNAKVFFPQNQTLTHQTMDEYLTFDRAGSLLYEGFRNDYNGTRRIAMGDATAMFHQPSDLSIYSSAFLGAFAGILGETNVEGILQIDLNATDSFGINDYARYLYYNPYEIDRTIRFEGGSESYDLYDAVSKRFVAKNVSGDVNVSIPAGSASVLVVLPANSILVREGDDVSVNGILIARYQASVNLSGLSSRAELTSSSVIAIGYAAPKGDEVTAMQISFGGIVVYDGVPITSFSYDKALLPDTDYTMKITITTRAGRTDSVTKRVVCR